MRSFQPISGRISETVQTDRRDRRKIPSRERRSWSRWWCNRWPLQSELLSRTHTINQSVKTHLFYIYTVFQKKPSPKNFGWQ